MNSQNHRLIQYMNKGGVLTTIKIVKMFGIASPTKRISEIRRSGYPLEGIPVVKKGVRFMQWKRSKSLFTYMKAGTVVKRKAK